MDKKNDRPEAYPKPSQADNQFNNQNEFIDQQPNDFEDTSVNTVSTRESSPESSSEKSEDPGK